MPNIVITGASRGLGLEFVKQLSNYSKTPNIFALCRNPDEAERLQSVARSCPNVSIIKADMVDFKGYKNVVSDIQQQIKAGGVNLLINNAGIMAKDTVRNVSPKNLIGSFEINTMAPLLFTQALLPLLKTANSNVFPLTAGKAAVLNISAHLGSIEENSNGDYLSYRISKAAVNMVTRSLSVELKPSQIFVMALHPGWVKTDMGGDAAPLTPEVSVKSMLAVLATADESHRGYLFNSKGKKIPW